MVYRDFEEVKILKNLIKPNKRRKKTNHLAKKNNIIYKLQI